MPHLPMPAALQNNIEYRRYPLRPNASSPYP